MSSQLCLWAEQTGWVSAGVDCLSTRTKLGKMIDATKTDGTWFQQGRVCLYLWGGSPPCRQLTCLLRL